MQSTNNFDLERLSRIHDVDEVLSSFSMLREAGFDNINLDLIFGLPWQNLASWENSLKRAVTLQPEHFSLYSLIIEPGTRLHDWHQTVSYTHLDVYKRQPVMGGSLRIKTSALLGVAIVPLKKAYF